jgi:hypothetical protein
MLGGHFTHEEQQVDQSEHSGLQRQPKPLAEEERKKKEM